jgi:hypothetical protein
VPVTYYTVSEVDDKLRWLKFALRGGNANKDNAELLEFFADRLVTQYGEDPNTDYVRCARERAQMIRDALKSADRNPV